MRNLLRSFLKFIDKLICFKPEGGWKERLAQKRIANYACNHDSKISNSALGYFQISSSRLLFFCAPVISHNQNINLTPVGQNKQDIKFRERCVDGEIIKLLIEWTWWAIIVSSAGHGLWDAIKNATSFYNLCRSRWNQSSLWTRHNKVLRKIFPKIRNPLMIFFRRPIISVCSFFLTFSHSSPMMFFFFFNNSSFYGILWHCGAIY